MVCVVIEMSGVDMACVVVVVVKKSEIRFLRSAPVINVLVSRERGLADIPRSLFVAI